MDKLNESKKRIEEINEREKQSLLKLIRKGNLAAVSLSSSMVITEKDIRSMKKKYLFSLLGLDIVLITKKN